jgi:hypothetical protein
VLGEERHLYTGPIYDLFAPDLPAVFSESTDQRATAEYMPTVGISVARGYGSYLRDLIIPAKFELELQRELLRVEDLVSDGFGVNVKLRATALNLFGSRGAYPYFSAFEDDEYSWSAGFGANFVSNDTTTYQLLLQQLLFFGSGEKSQLSISNRTEIDWGTETEWNEVLETIFTWNTPLTTGISIPLINIEIEKDVYFKHEESVSLDISGSPINLTLLLSHSSELILGDIGSLTGLLHIGVGYGEEIWLFGLEGGLRAKVTF